MHVSAMATKKVTGNFFILHKVLSLCYVVRNQVICVLCVTEHDMCTYNGMSSQNIDSTQSFYLLFVKSLHELLNWS